jgi:predicted dehydrogenase
MVVGVGIIGTNWGGKVQTPIFRAAGLEVVALYSRDLKKAQSLCSDMKIKYAFDSVEALCACPEVQVVSVTSPTYLHPQHALAALRAGKHVLSDKPAGANVADVTEMVKEAVRRPEQFAIIDHEMRFTPAILAARQAIFVDKAIGELKHFDLHQMMNFGSFGKNHVWWNEKEKGGGILGAAGVHMIDQLHFITGQKVVAVNAMTETFVKEKRMHPKQWKTKEDETRMIPCTAEEYVAATFRCDGGAIGSFSITGVMTGTGGGTIYFNGTTGSALIDAAGKFTLRDAKGKVLREASDSRLPAELRKAAGNHAGAPALGTFVVAEAMKSYIEDGKKDALQNACTFEDGLYNQRVIEAIHSSSTGAMQSRL